MTSPSTSIAKHCESRKKEILDVLARKLGCGGSDRASKILKFGEFLIGALDNYSHYAYDNHITDTSFEEVQKIPRVVRAEKAVKLSYSIFKNSASQMIRLADIGREMKRRTVRPRD